MTQPNYEDLDPIDPPSTVPNALKTPVIRMATQ